VMCDRKLSVESTEYHAVSAVCILIRQINWQV
jgi:hypothetical protein